MVLANRSSRAIFLCYHSVAQEGPRYLTVTPELFERQLAELRRRRLRFGGLGALEEIAAGSPSRPTVFITFDDGFRDNCEIALPMLREHGLRAFVFILPPLVDRGSRLHWPEVASDSRRFATMRSVDWGMVGEMKEGGFEVGSHTLSHLHLPLLGGDELKQELSDSRRRIVEQLGSCDTLAYPFGEWSGRVAASARECGYKFAFSLPAAHGQRLADRHSIPRVNVDYRDDGLRFSLKLSPLGRRALLSPATRAVHRILRGGIGQATPG